MNILIGIVVYIFVMIVLGKFLGFNDREPRR